MAVTALKERRTMDHHDHREEAQKQGLLPGIMSFDTECWKWIVTNAIITSLTKDVRRVNFQAPWDPWKDMQIDILWRPEYIGTFLRSLSNLFINAGIQSSHGERLSH